jgi:hypothetical protein
VVEAPYSGPPVAGYGFSPPDGGWKGAEKRPMRSRFMRVTESLLRVHHMEEPQLKVTMEYLLMGERGENKGLVVSLGYEQDLFAVEGWSARTCHEY